MMINATCQEHGLPARAIGVPDGAAADNVLRALLGSLMAKLAAATAEEREQIGDLIDKVESLAALYRGETVEA